MIIYLYLIPEALDEFCDIDFKLCFKPTQIACDTSSRRKIATFT